MRVKPATRRRVEEWGLVLEELTWDSLGFTLDFDGIFELYGGHAADCAAARIGAACGRQRGPGAQPSPR